MIGTGGSDFTILLYSADEDIESTDGFEIGSLELCANGRASDPSVRMAVEHDGTAFQSWGSGRGQVGGPA